MTIKEHLRRLIFKLAASPRGIWIFFVFVRLIDMPISRLTNGKIIPSANGNIMPIYYLTMTGAKSNLPRSVPVLCIPDGKDLILIGSNWGKPRNPSWVYNLRAHPNVQTRKGQKMIDMVAIELHDGDREIYWKKATTFYPPYVSYEQRSGRILPIFLLTPRNH